MDAFKRYQVFVSSTYTDLLAERQSVISALLTLDAIPAGMELFPATNFNAWNLIKRVIDECDYYILIIGGKYGSVDSESGKSYTEMEYDYAKSQGKPMMAFLRADLENVPGRHLELNSAVAAELERFKSKVKRDTHVKFWTSADQLAGQVASSLHALIRDFPAVGWVRADRTHGAVSAAGSNVSPPGASAFASGSEPVTLEVHATFRYMITGDVWVRGRVDTRKEFSWDSLFAIATGSLLGECEQGLIHEEINSWLTDHLWKGELLPVDVTEQFREAGLDVGKASFSDVDVWITQADVGVLVIQFIALGLIEPGRRNRGVNDHGTYWRLTPHGMNYMVQLRAVKKRT
ncbi:DUF4062 domain-containing protein [Streptomyces labedae]|uniref:DUF4062 domain-containing protein n=1 Tax=Streptomyces labedae TaxID=285569 RepID=A0ABP6R409_9ACTN